MDPDISRWVLEFLLRSSVPDSLIHKTLTVLPLSGADNRLKKTLLLRTLQSHLLKASLTETALEIFEVLEDLDRNDAVPVTDAMRQAYCAVAVECTVKYLAASPDESAGEYFGAVRRIWRGRVTEMTAEGRRSGLFSGELTRWRDDIEAALWDHGVSERLASLNSRRDALKKVKVYLNEAWEIMGPSFLDSVATLSKANGLRPEGVCEYALGDESMGKRDGGMEGSAKERRDSVGGDRSDSDNDNDDDDACCMQNVAVTGEVQGKEQLEERVGASVDTNQEVGGLDLPTQGNKGLDFPTQGNKGIHKCNLQLKRKHSALRACRRGVKISGAEEVEPLKSWVPSPEVEKVRESLKSSSLELRALVKDPLPDAMHTSEIVRSKLATKDVPPIENLRGDIDVPDSDVCKSIVPFQPDNANLAKKSSVHCGNVNRPNIMKRTSTARTYEWDDSIDNLPQGRQPRRRKRKWSSLEEETLRAGVKMFGEGNWATIRNFYSNIFENRSGVDLKDKWRNMIR
ncbi:uncharacterized protein LOC133301342 isoform X2 [Gastrolobium bilobum]|uniref:uncharacterized protein LOC133301342 isoform X2 n=1 Tax=Gastrolobium bilobum TaxID=150636 RepID=UPI002AAFE3ED|nr:uncharacterized protein LOC133301342 isoform X2 [Gastrolobium bilobum]